MINQMPAAIPKLAGGVAEGAQGETVVKPSPGPSEIRMIVMPTAPTAPATIAPQWTPEAELSTEASGTTATLLTILLPLKIAPNKQAAKMKSSEHGRNDR